MLLNKLWRLLDSANSHYEKFADGTVKCIDDEIPFEIPQSWYWVRLGQVFSHCTGKALNGANKKGELYQYITTSNLYWDKFELTTLKEMYFTEDELDKCTAKKGDLLVCEGGDIGRSAIWNYDYDIRIQNHIHKLRSFMPICTRFFYHILYLYKGIGNIGGKGIGIQGLSSGALHNILLPFPSLNEQQRIVSKIEDLIPIVDKYEKSEEALNKLNAEIFDKLKKSVLQEAIQGKLVSQDPNDEPASVLLERIKEEKAKLFKEGKLKKKDLVGSVIFKGEDNKYYEKVGSQVTCIDDDIPFEIPSSWSWIRLGNYTDVIGGYAFQSQDLKSENGCRVIRISDISEDGLVNNRIVRYNGKLDLSQYRIYNSDILMAMTGGTVGKSLLLKLDNKEVLFLNQRVAIIRNTWFDVNYIDTVIKSAYIKSIIDNSKNSTNDNISMADITGFLIPIPPLNEQHRIINKLEFVIASIMRR